MNSEERFRYLGFISVITIIFLGSVIFSISKVSKVFLYSQKGRVTNGIIEAKDIMDYKSYFYTISYKVQNEYLIARIHSDQNFGEPDDSVSICYLSTNPSKIIFSRDKRFNYSIVALLCITFLLMLLLIFAVLRPNWMVRHIRGEIS